MDKGGCLIGAGKVVGLTLTARSWLVCYNTPTNLLLSVQLNLKLRYSR